MLDNAVAASLAVMLGGVPVRNAAQASLVAPEPDCVEVGSTKVVGGVRVQHFDVAYRPDGVRFAFDSKTLNDTSSVRKNYQNMVNDIATEATTVHTRFPYAVVSFMVAIPMPCLLVPQRTALVGTLERLTGRVGMDEPSHLAEAIALVVWDPMTGAVDLETPDSSSPLALDRFSQQVERAYVDRYKGLPPHAAD